MMRALRQTEKPCKAKRESIRNRHYDNSDDDNAPGACRWVVVYTVNDC